MYLTYIVYNILALQLLQFSYVILGDNYYYSVISEEAVFVFIRNLIVFSYYVTLYDYIYTCNCFC